MAYAKIRLIVFITSIILVFCVSAALAGPLRLYVDADMTGARASSLAIKRGILTALDEVEYQLDGRQVEVVTLNHRGNSARSLLNLRKYLADPDALALFTGQHSPPLLIHRDFINKNKILTLDPWAAAGPITRPPYSENWIFRLSIDDTKAGEAIVRRALDERGFTRPALLLENTGWGDSNLKTMTASLEKRISAPVEVFRFGWGISPLRARILLRDIKQSGADVIFLVANAPEGKTLCQAMSDLYPTERIPIISHWGITGGDYSKVVTAAMRRDLDLEFLQTTFSFNDMGDAPFPNAVFRRVTRLFPEVAEPKDISAPTGFVHAYDLTRILIAAVRQTGLTGNMHEDRVAVRNALERLKEPVVGLIKTYKRPFRPYSPDDMDAHEALDANDLTFGKYDDDNAIILVR